MTLQECITKVDAVKPNDYSVEEKVAWLSYLDGMIMDEVIKTHETDEEMPDTWENYDPTFLSRVLLAEDPYSELYVAYIKMKIDEENGETARYNNSAAMYNSLYLRYAKQYNKTHMPLRADMQIYRKRERKDVIPKIFRSEPLQRDDIDI